MPTINLKLSKTIIKTIKKRISKDLSHFYLDELYIFLREMILELPPIGWFINVIPIAAGFEEKLELFRREVRKIALLRIFKKIGMAWNARLLYQTYKQYYCYYYYYFMNYYFEKKFNFSNNFLFYFKTALKNCIVKEIIKLINC